MTDQSYLGPWVRRFLLEHLLSERNLSRNTQHSYRDTLRLLIPFVAARLSTSPDRLVVTDLSADLVRQFLTHVEVDRRCCTSTRNQRLAAIHALARFIAAQSPEHIEWCSHLTAIPFKKTMRTLVHYLDKPEMDALLSAPDTRAPLGRRDHALLLFLLSSGARADEAAQLTIQDLKLSASAGSGQSFVTIHGKGNKLRSCPLWSNTTSALLPLVVGRGSAEHVFLNRCGEPLTRFGIHALIKRYARRACAQDTSLNLKSVSPHVIRHTTATYLLRSGVDLNTIRSWLGHVSLATTSIYAEIDLETKARALASCEAPRVKRRRRWKDDANLMAFLRSL